MTTRVESNIRTDGEYKTVDVIINGIRYVINASDIKDNHLEWFKNVFRNNIVDAYYQGRKDAEKEMRCKFKELLGL